MLERNSSPRLRPGLGLLSRAPGWEEARRHVTCSSRRGRRPRSVPGTQALLLWPCCAPRRVHLEPRSLLGSRATGDLECPPEGT